MRYFSSLSDRKAERSESKHEHNKTKHYPLLFVGVHEQSVVSPLCNTLPRTSPPPVRSANRVLTSFRLCTRIPGPHAYTQQQRQAHESPVLFYFVVLGYIGPVLAFGVPPIRERMATAHLSRYQLHTQVRFFIVPHILYSRLVYAVPKRPRRLAQGYENEERKDTNVEGNSDCSFHFSVVAVPSCVLYARICASTTLDLFVHH
jgi:hypothetical protein